MKAADHQSTAFMLSESLTNQALRPDSTRNRVWVQDFPVQLDQAGHLKLKSA